MNRNITLIISAVLLILLLVIWLYLVFFADRSSDEPNLIEGSGEFAEFDGLGSDAPSPGPGGGNSGGQNDGSNGNNSEEGYDPDILRQLTTRKVVGYVETDIASSTHVVFMESGVGHIYSINLGTGVEERVSATTIPDAREAVFSSDGTLVLVKTGDDTGYNSVSVGEIDYSENTVTMSPMADMVGEFMFVEDDEVLFTTQNNSGISIQTNDLNGSVDTIFTTPFREAIVILNTDVAGPHYFYPKISYLLEGFVYEYKNGSLNRLPLDGFGLAAGVAGDKVIASFRNQTKLVTEMLDTTDGGVTSLTTPLVPEKCVSVELNTYCAIPGDTTLQYNSINEWLKGTEMFSDNLWRVDTAGNEEMINIVEHSGRGVDVVNGTIGEISQDWYFRNKADDSLWIYELSKFSNIDVIEETES